MSFCIIFTDDQKDFPDYNYYEQEETNYLENKKQESWENQSGEFYTQYDDFYPY